jgi:hypothetical protein
MSNFVIAKRTVRGWMHGGQIGAMKGWGTGNSFRDYHTDPAKLTSQRPWSMRLLILDLNDAGSWGIPTRTWKPMRYWAW